MSASVDRRPVYVGLFVLVAMAILAGGILAVGNIRDTFTQKISVHVVFDQVNGLKSGDNVWCSGLKVGVVSKLEFVDVSKIDVELRVNEQMAKFIHKDAKAHIGSDGLIGNAIVVVTGGSPDQPLLADGDVLETEAKVSTADVMAMLQENNKNLLAITTDIKAVTGKLAKGEGTIGKLLTEEELYADVKSAVSTLSDAAVNARRLTASLATFSAKLNTPGHLPNDLATNETLMPSIAATIDSLQAAVAKADQTIAGLSAGASDPSTPVGALLHDSKAGGDLKTILSDLTKSTALLNEDLKAIQSNFLFRPYFKKKEREERKAAREAEAAAP